MIKRDGEGNFCTSCISLLIVWCAITFVCRNKTLSYLMVGYNSAHQQAPIRLTLQWSGSVPGVLRNYSAKGKGFLVAR